MNTWRSLRKPVTGPHHQKKEETAATGMLFLMQKSQDANTLLMAEDFKREEANRLRNEEIRNKERREIEARLARKDALQEALREDCREREEAARQVSLDREQASLQMRLDHARARKAQEATRRWEANQERLAMAQEAQQASQEETRQTFQLAMLKMMAR
ncbi:hypothetical protein VP01_162g1 [Puccinia sorghi]|uniref:Uncharacterized protein n=1 Tax=Puccinia sorghi TaxID=27349 RepID=A0A0L6VIQ1_9BASI|nr:hypothetical protein VP01_162g1 [Puccinia sorghi]